MKKVLDTSIGVLCLLVLALLVFSPYGLFTKIVLSVFAGILAVVLIFLRILADSLDEIVRKIDEIRSKGK